MLPLLLSLLPDVSANERRFTYTYESMVLPKEARELEPWATVTFLPDRQGIALSNRMELEWGISNRLLTAFYINWSADRSGASFDGISSEWKLNLLRRAVAPVGLALYGEVSAGPSETELEAKVIVDLDKGPLLVAYNLVGEVEWEYEAGESELEMEAAIENKLGVSVRAFKGVHLGLEVENANHLSPDDGFEGGELALGPALAVQQPHWWLASTLMIPVVSYGEETERGPIAARVILGFPF
jgi:hypothetical protein